MAQLVITGGRKLEGEIKVGGNKNAVLPCLAASILTTEKTVFTNVPEIEDVKTMVAILEDMGAVVTRSGDRLEIDPSGITKWELNSQLVAKLRASILFMGPLLARFGKMKLRHPGGCVIGRRPVGTHFEAIRQFGGDVITEEEVYAAHVEPKQNRVIFLDEASVTATENAMSLAAATGGKTIIMGAACEPHVANLGDYLRAMGAKITGAGSNVIEIEGSENLHGAEHRIGEDFMEAGTFAIMAAATGSHLIIHDAIQENFYMIGTYLREFGVDFRFKDSRTLEVSPSQLHAPVHVKEIQTRPWPGFPTDLLSPMIVLATQAKGSTLIHEWMFDSRLYFTDKLATMGANVIMCDPHRVIVQGSTRLRGKNLTSPDIRAGIALVIAALAADGTSTIDHAELIARGYEKLAVRLRALGAEIEEK